MNYEFNFKLGEKTSKFTFKSTDEINSLYIYCAINMHGSSPIILLYNNINLNFLRKNMKLGDIFRNKNEINISIIPQPSLLPQEPQLKDKKQEFKFPVKSENSFSLSKGNLSHLFLYLSNSNKINTLSMTDIDLFPDEQISVFPLISNKEINNLIIHPKILYLLDEKTYASLNVKKLHVWSKIKEFTNEILEYEINRIMLLKTEEIEMEESGLYIPVSLMSKSINKISLKNSFLHLKEDTTYKLNLSKLSLSFNYIKNLNEQIKHLEPFIEKITLLEIKYDSLDYEQTLELEKFFNNNIKLFSKSEEISLNLKCKLNSTLTESTENNIILNKICCMCLCPYSLFNSYDIKPFNHKLKNLRKLKLRNIDIELYDKNFEECISQMDNLMCLDIDENIMKIIYEFKDKELVKKLLGKINKLYIQDIDFIPKILNYIKIENIEKIMILNIIFDRNEKSVIFNGDILPIDNNESSYLSAIKYLLRSIIFSIPEISILNLYNFEKEEKQVYIITILSLLTTILISPKIKKLNLRNILIGNEVLEKFMYLFGYNNLLEEISVDGIITNNKQMDVLFFNFLLQCPNVYKMYFSNIEFNDYISKEVFEENDNFKRINKLGFISVRNLSCIFDYIISDQNIYIELTLKNVDLSKDNILKIINNNSTSLEYLDIDLELFNDKNQPMSNVEFLKGENLKLKNLKYLSLNDSFCYVNDNDKFSFLEKCWNNYPKLKKLNILLKVYNDYRKEKLNNIFIPYKYLNK